MIENGSSNNKIQDNVATTNNTSVNKETKIKMKEKLVKN